MDGLLIGIALPAVAVSFMIGYIRRSAVRRATLSAMLIAPVLVVTLVLALTPPHPPSFLAWWPTAMIMIGPVVAAYIGAALTGFILARKSIG